MIDPALGYLVILDMAALLGWSALQKLGARREFFEVLTAYRVLPERWVPAAVYVLPSAELLIALALLIPVSRRAAGVAAAGLLLIYGCAIAVNLARGRRDLDCGCGLASGRRTIAEWMLVRNATMTCAAVTVALPWAPRTLALLDIMTIVAGASAAALLYASIDALLGRVVPAAAIARAR
jgi:uncharacterized membrane protein